MDYVKPCPLTHSLCQSWQIPMLGKIQSVYSRIQFHWTINCKLKITNINNRIQYVNRVRWNTIRSLKQIRHLSRVLEVSPSGETRIWRWRWHPKRAIYLMPKRRTRLLRLVIPNTKKKKTLVFIGLSSKEYSSIIMVLNVFLNLRNRLKLVINKISNKYPFQCRWGSCLKGIHVPLCSEAWFW